jgi:hypothetical protein
VALREFKIPGPTAPKGFVGLFTGPAAGMPDGALTELDRGTIDSDGNVVSDLAPRPMIGPFSAGYPIAGIHRVRHSDGQDQTLVAAYPAVRLCTNEMAGLTSCLTDSLIADVRRVVFAQFRDTVYFTDGVNPVRRYAAGSLDCHPAGLAPPTVRPHFHTYYLGSFSYQPMEPGYTGITDGLHHWRWTFVRGGYGESRPGPEFTFNCYTLPGGANTGIVGLSFLGPVPSDVTAIRLYRTAAGGETYRRVTNLLGSPTTWLIWGFRPGNASCSEIPCVDGVPRWSEVWDGMADADLGVELDTDVQDLPTAAIVFMHHDRLFLAAIPESPWEVHFSELGYPDIFHDGDLVEGLGKTSGKVMTVEALGDALVFLKEDSIWVLSGTGPDTFSLVCVAPERGCDSAASVVSMGNGLLFVSGGRVVAFDGILVREIDEPIAEILAKTPKARLSQSVAGLIRGVYHLSYPASGSQENSVTLRFDTKNGTWSRTTAVAVSSFCEFPEGDGGYIWFGHPSDNRVYLVDAKNRPTYEEGVPFVMETKSLDFGAPGLYKDCARLWVDATALDGVIATVRVDDAIQTKELEVDGEGHYVYGGTTWAEGRWVEGKRRIFPFRFPPGCVGRTFGVHLETVSKSERVMIHGLTILYNLKRRWN